MINEIETLLEKNEVEDYNKQGTKYRQFESLLSLNKTTVNNIKVFIEIHKIFLRLFYVRHISMSRAIGGRAYK